MLPCLANVLVGHCTAHEPGRVTPLCVAELIKVYSPTIFATDASS